MISATVEENEAKKDNQQHKSDGEIQSAITPKRIQQSNIFDCRLPPNLPQHTRTHTYAPKNGVQKHRRNFSIFSIALQHWPFAISVLCSRPAKVLIGQVGGKHYILFDKTDNARLSYDTKTLLKIVQHRPLTVVSNRMTSTEWNELTAQLFFICTQTELLWRLRIMNAVYFFAFNLLHQLRVSE